MPGLFKTLSIHIFKIHTDLLDAGSSFSKKIILATVNSDVVSLVIFFILR